MSDKIQPSTLEFYKNFRITVETIRENFGDVMSDEDYIAWRAALQKGLDVEESAL